MVTLSLYFICFLICGGYSLEIDDTDSLSSTEQRFTADPPSGSSFRLHDTKTIRFTLQDETVQYIISQNSSRFYIGVEYNTSRITSRNVVLTSVDLPRLYKINSTSYYEIPEVVANDTQLAPNISFTISADMKQIGYANLAIQVLETASDNTTRLLATELYALVCVREVRLVDIGFNAAITILVVMNTFALGCVTDFNTIKMAMDKKHIGVAMCTQCIIIPIVS